MVSDKEIIASSIYDSFVCIADKCDISCCKEWKIAVDEQTEKKWKNKKLHKENKDMASHIMIMDGEKIIKLNHKNCPFLDEQGLCKIVSQLGEEYISDTCTVFPRQVNEFNDRIEKTLVSCCPHVIDMINESKIDIFEKFVKNEKKNLFYVRGVLIDMLLDSKNSVSNALLTSFYMLTEILRTEKNSKKNTVANYTTGNIENICSTASVKECSRIINQLKKNNKEDSFYESNELFFDIIDNYYKEGLYYEFLSPLKELSENVEFDNYHTFEQNMIEYDDLFRKWLINEYICNLIIEDDELEDDKMNHSSIYEDIINSKFIDSIEHMIVKFEWIVMEYIVIKQALYLRYILNNEELTYDDVRKSIVIVARMTGYDDEDIYEYMVNSFENPVWEWGYMFLLMQA